MAVSSSAKTEEELEIEREIEADELRAKDDHQKREEAHNWHSVQGDLSRDCMKDGSCWYEKTEKGFKMVIDTKKVKRDNEKASSYEDAGAKAAAEQAKIDAAAAKASEIVSAASAEADGILSAAKAEASGITGSAQGVCTRAHTS